jgi:hypothetical protein
MPKLPIVSREDIESDLKSIEQSFCRIENPQIRYWLALLADLVAEGVVAVDARASKLALSATEKRKTSIQKFDLTSQESKVQLKTASR